MTTPKFKDSVMSNMQPLQQPYRIASNFCGTKFPWLSNSYSIRGSAAD